MKYKIIYQEEGEIKELSLLTQNIDEHNLPKNIIQIKKYDFHININIFNNIKDKDLKNIFYEFSLMLESKILLDEAFEILIKSQKNHLLKEFLITLRNSFRKSINIYESLNVFKINPLVKSFFRITQDTGNTTLMIQSLSKIIDENYEIKNNFVKSMIYPIILFVSVFLSFIGIFKFVVPKFEFMFKQNSYELPFATKMLFFVKDIFENYLFLISIGLLVFFVLLFVLYKKFKKVRYSFDEFISLKIPVVSSIYRLKTFYIYFTIMQILLNNKYEFNECLVKAKLTINNYFILDKINQIENALKSGKSIYSSFEQAKLFDEISLNLIRTGELTNSLELTIKEIKKINKKRFDEKLKLFTQLIEPIFLLLVMSLIIWIILAIFVPLWDIGDMLKV